MNKMKMMMGGILPNMGMMMNTENVKVKGSWALVVPSHGSKNCSCIPTANNDSEIVIASFGSKKGCLKAKKSQCG